MSGSIRQMVVRHPVAAFLVMVYWVNIAVACPSILTRRDLLPFDFAPTTWINEPTEEVAQNA